MQQDAHAPSCRSSKVLQRDDSAPPLPHCRICRVHPEKGEDMVEPSRFGKKVCPECATEYLQEGKAVVCPNCGSDPSKGAGAAAAQPLSDVWGAPFRK